MSKDNRLGQLLLAKGLIDEPALEEALRARLLSGTRLGTALVQQEALRLDALGPCLAEQHGVPEAPDGALEAIPDGVALRVSGDLCTRHCVVPFRLEGEVLHLAMRDPHERVAAAIAAVTGLEVERYVVPELRMMFLLERYYGQIREPRFLRLPPARPRAGTEERRRYLAASFQPPPADEAAQSSVEEDPTGRRETMSLSTYDLPVVVKPPVSTTAVLDEVLTALETAVEGEQVSDLLVRPVLANTAVSVLFWVRGRHAVAAGSDGTSVRGRELRKIVLPLDPPSMLRWAIQEQSLLLDNAEYDWLMQGLANRLGLPALGEVAVAPVFLMGAVVAVACFMTCRGTSFTGDAIEQLKLLSEGASAAFRRLAAS